MNKIIEIRRANTEDSEHAVRIVFPILRSFGIEPDPNGLDLHIVSFGKNNPNEVIDFVAELNKEPVGILTISLEKDNETKVAGLYVSHKARRNGIGRKLLKRAVEETRKLNKRRIALETREMFKEAVMLYESEGWNRGEDLPKGYGPDRTYFLDVNEV